MPEYFPAVQLMHVVAPVTAEYFPAGQSVQRFWKRRNVPSGQAGREGGGVIYYTKSRNRCSTHRRSEPVHGCEVLQVLARCCFEPQCALVTACYRWCTSAGPGLRKAKVASLIFCRISPKSVTTICETAACVGLPHLPRI